VLVTDLDDTDDKAREALLDLFYAAMVMKTGATDLRALTNEALRRELMVCAGSLYRSRSILLITTSIRSKLTGLVPADRHFDADPRWIRGEPFGGP
jgi:hypothetical protein